MEIRCIKCRYKYDINICDNQQEVTVICPRCGAIQTTIQSPDTPEVAPTYSENQSRVTDVHTPSPDNIPPTSIPEDHLKYIPSDEPKPQYEPNVAPPQSPSAVQNKPEEPVRKSPTPPTPPKKKSSCGKMFALGCLVVAVLAVLTIAIISFAGKSLFNTISSSDNNEQEHVEETKNNITIQPTDEASSIGNSDYKDEAQQNADNTHTANGSVTDTGDEGNSNTTVKEREILTEEQKQKVEKDVAKAGGNYNCKGTMANDDITLTLNITSGGFVTGKLVYKSSDITLEISGDKYGDEFFLNATNDKELIKINLKREGKDLKGTATKELQKVPISVTY